MKILRTSLIPKHISFVSQGLLDSLFRMLLHLLALKFSYLDGTVV